MSTSRTEDHAFASDPVNAGKIAQARDRLLRFVEQFAWVATALKRITFHTMLLSILNFCLLGWFLFYGFDLSWWLASLLMLFVALPSGAMIMVYLALDAASEMPETVRELKGTVNDIATRMVRDKRADTVQIPDSGGLLSRLKNSFSVLRYLASLVGQVAGVSEVLSGIMLIVNPLFPVVMILGMGLTWFLGFVGLMMVVFA